MGTYPTILQRWTRPTKAYSPSLARSGETTSRSLQDIWQTDCKPSTASTSFVCFSAYTITFTCHPLFELFFHRSYLKTTTAIKIPLLRKVDKQKRLLRTKKRKNWILKEKKTVLWTDGSEFELFDCESKVSVKRKPGERLNDERVLLTVKHFGGSVMVWWCFGRDTTWNFVHVKGIMKREQYHLQRLIVWVLWHINPCRSFNAKFCQYIHTYSTKDFKTNIKVGKIFY